MQVGKSSAACVGMFLFVNTKTKVFILGAGCSADCGYPLGVGLATEFQTFLQQIPDDCPTIKQGVSETIKLLATLPNVETLDQLVQRIELDLDNWKKQRNSFIADTERSNKEKLAAKQILDAKIATNAMFLARESDAKNTFKKLQEFHHRNFRRTALARRDTTGQLSCSHV